MKITELDAYKRLEQNFKQKGFSKGFNEEMTICYSFLPDEDTEDNVPNYYAHQIKNRYLKFEDVPVSYRTREFFLNTLSDVHRDIVNYVKAHLGTEFDRQFFKDHIATDYYALEFENNDFEYMPLKYIDEEMVACAMLRAVNARYVERRNQCDDWFYSVYRRKPEVLTQDLFTLGARCFAAKRRGENRFLDITPEKYRTSEYYFALCLFNNTPVMEDIPEEILTTDFLLKLLNQSPKNIQCFTEEPLERQAFIEDLGTVKFWQAAVIMDGYEIEHISLNEERINFFLSNYGKNSPEYRLSFKDSYNDYKLNLNMKDDTVRYKLEGVN